MASRTMTMTVTETVTVIGVKGSETVTYGDNNLSNGADNCYGNRQSVKDDREKLTNKG